jgi:hypothetical protein
MIEVGRYFPSFTLDNFFTNEEFEYLSNLDFSDHTEKNLNPEKIAHKNLDIIRTDIQEEIMMAIYHNFDMYNDSNIKKIFSRIFSDGYKNKERIKTISEDKIRGAKDYTYENPNWYTTDDNILFFQGLKTINLHILQSFNPYTIHHDFQHEPKQDVPNPAWTMIIPLEDYNSHTINFKQQPNNPLSKTVDKWIKNENPPILNKITDKEYEKYFKGWISYESLKYLEIDRVFKWKKNKLYAASRFNFHCSDYFFMNNLTEKRAVVMWTCF